MFGDHVELLFHRQRDLDGTTDQHGERGDQRFELDVDFRPVAAAKIRHFDAHAVFRPTEQPRDFDSHE